MSREKKLAGTLFSRYTRKYHLQKTMGFRLELVEESQRQKANEFLLGDRENAQNYSLVKAVVDRFYRWFIQEALKDFKFDWSPLAKTHEEYLRAKKRKEAIPKDEQVDLESAGTNEKTAALTVLEKEEKNARKTLGDAMDEFRKAFAQENGFCKKKEKEQEAQKDKKFSITNASTLLKTILPQFWLEHDPEITAEEKNAVGRYAACATILAPLMEARKNVFSTQDISTSVLQRIVHDNFPKHLKNCKLYEKLPESIQEQWDRHIQRDFQEELLALGVQSVSDVFTLDFYNRLLTQKAITDYNTLLGGKNEKNQKTAHKGFNKYIHEYNQKMKKKSDKLPAFVDLYKIMLAEPISNSTLPLAFEDASQMCEYIAHCYQTISDKLFGPLKQLFEDLENNDLSKILISRKSLTDLSNTLFQDYSLISTALDYYYENVERPDYAEQFCSVNRKVKDQMYSQKNKWLEQESFSMKLLDEAIAKFVQVRNDELGETNMLQYASGDLVKWFSDFPYREGGAPESGTSIPVGRKADKTVSKVKTFDAVIRSQYQCVQGILNCPETCKEQWKDEKARSIFIGNLKLLLDSIMSLVHFVQPFYTEIDDEERKDAGFYNEFTRLWELLAGYYSLYDRVRNFVAKKPYSNDKIRLCFGHTGNFLGGWVESQTENSNNGTQYGGYIFRKRNTCNEYDYYLGVSQDSKLFSSKKNVLPPQRSEYERLEYYQLKKESIYGSSFRGPVPYPQLKSDMITCLEQLVSNSGDNELKELVQKEQAKKQPKISTPKGFMEFIQTNSSQTYQEILSNARFQEINERIIDALKATMAGSERVPSAKEYNKRKYRLFTEIDSDIDALTATKLYRYFSIDQTELENTMTRKDKPLFLFKITNKDLSYAQTSAQGIRKSRGKKNLHTMYFEQLLSGKQTVFDIGTGMVFFRDKSVSYSPEIMRKGHHHNELKDKFNYPIIKDKRYTRDQYQFHLSMTINFSKDKPNANFNTDVLESLSDYGADQKIIGLDRGENNLIYLTMIDQSGTIILQKTLNAFETGYSGVSGAKNHITDYQVKLTQRQNEQNAARQSWQIIGQIKKLKEGYLSQAVHEIVTLMVKNNAIIVLENLNFGFKKHRICVGKQVYQKFEKALIDKLNYLVFKDREPDQAGGVLNGYQLTLPIQKYTEMVRQNGFLFYVPAEYTSSIDPTTGFVNLVNTRYETVVKAQTLLTRFDSIRYNPQENFFEFELDYDRFEIHRTPAKKRWIVCTHGGYRYAGNKRINPNPIDVTQRLCSLFDKFAIVYGKGADIKKAIVAQNSAAFYKELLFLLGLTLQLRYSGKGASKSPKRDEDFILSPVRNRSGKLFDSREYFDIAKTNATPELPQDADANGAYHIALKGLWLLKNGFPRKNWIASESWFQYRQEGKIIDIDNTKKKTAKKS